MSIRKLIPLLASLAFVLAACGGGGGDATGGADDGCVDLTGSETFTVTMRDSVFEPSCFTASASQGITLVNEDGLPHTFTLEDTEIDVEIAADETFDGEAVSGVVEPGTYDLVCRIHPQMTGEVTIVA
ncbi:MAG TPA: cupredoxin domain-containing protein [Actinomycetota bacterium]|nr:cupredoxin domain-containing protein [Actinomycetota bacterium]